MKKLLLALFAAILYSVFLTGALHAQSDVWTIGMGSWDAEYCTNMTIDQDDNIITIGTFSTEMDFDPGPGEQILMPSASFEIYILKTDSDGHTLWVKDLNAWEHLLPAGVRTDADGNIFIIGSFVATTDFDPGPGTAFLTPGSTHGFLLKLDGGGNFQWVRQINSSGLSSIHGLAVDPSGNICIAGEFFGNLQYNLGGNIHSVSSVGQLDGYVMKFNPLGEIQWLHPLVTDDCFVNSVDFNESGELAAAGWFTGSLDFNPGPAPYILPSVNSLKDAFVCKLDADGNLQWAKAFGGDKDDEVSQVQYDPAGNVVLGGAFNGTCDFDPGLPEYDITAASSTVQDIFIEKLNSSGEFLWAKALSGTSSKDLIDLDVDQQGNIYGAGLFLGTVDFDPGIASFNLTTQYAGPFNVKLDFDGNFAWARTLLGAAGRCMGIRAGKEDALYTAGIYQGTIQNIPDPITSSFGSFDLFLQKSISYQWDFPGRVFYDANANGVEDTGDWPVPGHVVQVRHKNYAVATDSSGNFRFSEYIRHDTVEVPVPWPNNAVVPPYFVDDSLNSSVKFAVEGPPSLDVCLAMVEKTPFRPGFDNEISVQVKNVGLIPVDSIPVIVKISQQTTPLPVEYVTAIPMPGQVINQEEFHWLINHLDINEMREFKLILHTPISLSNGTEVVLSGSAWKDNDQYPFNNDVRMHSFVTGAVDPNDKQVYPRSTTAASTDTTDLQYLVRFQNTGTHPADNVVVRDTLASALDLSTLKILGASHPFTWRLAASNLLEFRFDNIQLPDSTANEPESHGFAAFSIRPKPGLHPGDSIRNRVGIYFDFNRPVMTNYAVFKVLNTMAAPTPTGASRLDFSVEPNPAKSGDAIFLEFSRPLPESGAALIFDGAGRLLSESRLVRGATRVSLPALGPGQYFVLARAGGCAGGKVLVMEN